MKKKFCREILSLTLTATLFLQIPAQLKALKIGDAIPEEVWKTPLQVVNSGEKTITLAKDRDKLILLDFWATWCSACLLNFPGMEALEEKFSDRIKIMPVTEQTDSVLEKFFTTKNGQRFSHVASVINDKMLKSYFPHKGIPFIVWIKDGKLINTTDAEQVTAENISKILGGDPDALHTVIQMDRTRPLMLDESFERQRNVSLLNYSIFMKGGIPDIGAGGTFRYTADKKVNGRQFTNLPLRDMYFAIGYELFQSMNIKESFSEKRMLVQIKNTKAMDGELLPGGNYRKDDLYSYELVVPAEKADSLYQFMLKDLNRYTAFSAKIEKIKTDCYILKRTVSENRIQTKGGDLISTFPQKPSILRNAPLKHMVNMINGQTPIRLPLINETGIMGNVDLRVSEITTAEKLSKELAKYGLTVTREQRELEMLVIKDQ
ncbi:TlpA family protein disulfide reductase [Kaistella sp. DKR-2]|uniref:TlpA family protein disulfide reductase n=1 Tax=Kaistella soli TaxID=2849654 RepID=UPI001C25200E|nr:TlpA disulfide reductase family protein [Kaistella soli]MBU8883848.1 TlpA family protein disulfide reductase [Kaistella soli]